MFFIAIQRGLRFAADGRAQRFRKLDERFTLPALASLIATCPALTT
jgi:hypothetical protein